jgi:hypothetical protein
MMRMVIVGYCFGIRLQMEGSANGAPHPPSAYAKMFSGKYEHQTRHRRHRGNLP